MKISRQSGKGHAINRTKSDAIALLIRPVKNRIIKDVTKFEKVFL